MYTLPRGPRIRQNGFSILSGVVVVSKSIYSTELINTGSINGKNSSKKSVNKQSNSVKPRKRVCWIGSLFLTTGVGKEDITLIKYCSIGDLMFWFPLIKRWRLLINNF